MSTLWPSSLYYLLLFLLYPHRLGSKVMTIKRCPMHCLSCILALFLWFIFHFWPLLWLCLPFPRCFISSHINSSGVSVAAKALHPKALIPALSFTLSLHSKRTTVLWHEKKKKKKNNFFHRSPVDTCHNHKRHYNLAEYQKHVFLNLIFFKFY